MNNPKVLWGIKIAIMMLLFFFVVSYVVMVLWNWLVPDLFNGPYINFWKAAGLLLLSKILFSGIGGKKFEKKSHMGGWKGHLVHKQELTPEQKQALKEKFANKWWCSYEEEKPSEAKLEKEEVERNT